MDSSPFGRLAVELRLELWKLSLRQSEPIQLGRVRGSNLQQIRHRTSKVRLNLLALLKVSRQVHAECSGLFYEVNEFAFEDDGVTHTITNYVAAMSRWANSIGPVNSGAINSVILSDTYGTMHWTGEPGGTNDTSDRNRLRSCAMRLARIIRMARSPPIDLLPTSSSTVFPPSSQRVWSVRMMVGQQPGAAYRFTYPSAKLGEEALKEVQVVTEQEVVRIKKIYAILEREASSAGRASLKQRRSREKEMAVAAAQSQELRRCQTDSDLMQKVVRGQIKDDESWYEKARLAHESLRFDE